MSGAVSPPLLSLHSAQRDNCTFLMVTISINTTHEQEADGYIPLRIIQNSKLVNPSPVFLRTSVDSELIERRKLRNNPEYYSSQIS